MATVGSVTVDKLAIYVSEDSGTTWAVVACQMDASFSPTIDTIEKDCKDTGGGADHTKGKFRWEMSGSGVFAFDAGYGWKNLYAKMKTGDAKVEVKFSTEELGDTYEEGEALITATPLNSSGGSNAFVEFSFTLLGLGIPTTTTV